MNKSKIGTITLVTILLLTLSVSLVAAVIHETEKITDITISSDGTFTATVSDLGITYSIEGTAGATGTVTTTIYLGNPQTTALIPNGVSLTHFIGVSFDMNAQDFASATITISYTDSDVQNIKQPFTVYKYDPSSDSYLELPSTVDAAAKTITFTLISVNDPLLAIGGATADEPAKGGISEITWAIVIVSVIAIILAVVLVFSRYRHSATSSSTLSS